MEISKPDLKYFFLFFFLILRVLIRSVVRSMGGMIGYMLDRNTRKAAPIHWTLMCLPVMALRLPTNDTVGYMTIVGYGIVLDMALSA